MSHTVGSQGPRPSPLRRALGAAVTALLVVVAIACAAAAVVVVANDLHFARAVSGSMEPMFKPGDALVVKPVSRERLSVGDVVLLPESPGSSSIRAHRIIAVSDTDEGIAVTTKGDANPAADSPPMVVESAEAPVVEAVIPLSAVPISAPAPALAAGILGALLVWALWPVGRRTIDLRRAPTRVEGAQEESSLTGSG